MPPTNSRSVPFDETAHHLTVSAICADCPNGPFALFAVGSPYVPECGRVQAALTLTDTAMRGLQATHYILCPRQYRASPFRRFGFLILEAGSTRYIMGSRNATGAPDMVSRERMWKLVSVASGLLGALLARRLIRVAYQIVRRDTAPVTPFDPTDPRFSWPDAVLWAAAAGIGLGIAKVVSARLAAFGWEAATGTLPPGAVEEPAHD